MFADAQRLYEAKGLAIAFQNLATGRGIKTYGKFSLFMFPESRKNIKDCPRYIDLQFVNTFLAQRMGSINNGDSSLPKVFETFIGQENLHGQPFRSGILGQIDEHIAQTLTAFQHYMYNLKNGTMAINDFQGKSPPCSCLLCPQTWILGYINNGCLTVYDCAIHTKYVLYFEHPDSNL